MHQTLPEIAAELGVSRTTLWRWTQRKGAGFPAPAGTRGNRYTYNAGQVAEWLNRWKPACGRKLGAKIVNGQVIPPAFRPGD